MFIDTVRKSWSISSQGETWTIGWHWIAFGWIGLGRVRHFLEYGELKIKPLFLLSPNTDIKLALPWCNQWFLINYFLFPTSVRTFPAGRLPQRKGHPSACSDRDSQPLSRELDSESDLGNVLPWTWKAEKNMDSKLQMMGWKSLCPGDANH